MSAKPTETDTLGTVFQGEYFRCVNPSSRSPILIIVDCIHVMAVDRHHTGCRVVQEHANESATNQQLSTADAIDEW
ncbi:hypothetical protein KC330_g31 [Hortaea werneckii]|nr:hypothetical protein KC330_g31 [Hortaea werneckii]